MPALACVCDEAADLARGLIAPDARTVTITLEKPAALFLSTNIGLALLIPAALLLQSEAGLTPAQTRARLQGAARDLGKAGPDEVFGHGLVQPAGGCIP